MRSAQEWYPTQRPLVTAWMCRTQDAEQKGRLWALGNAVVPAFARLAFHFLQHAKTLAADVK